MFNRPKTLLVIEGNSNSYDLLSTYYVQDMCWIFYMYLVIQPLQWCHYYHYILEKELKFREVLKSTRGMLLIDSRARIHTHIYLKSVP